MIEISALHHFRRTVPNLHCARSMDANQTKTNSMKKLAIGALSALAITTGAFAGQPMAGKDYKSMPEPCIKDVELQLDLFGSYNDTVGNNHHGDGFGGGVAINYFFMRYLGVGVEGNVYDGDANAVWSAGGRLIARYPIDSACFVPYVFAAGGVQTNGETSGTFGLGGGLEYRVIAQKLGIFAEGRYTWAGSDEDNAQVRFGVRVVF